MLAVDHHDNTAVEFEGMAERLREARDEKGLSRAQVSKRTGIPPKAIEKFEAGTQEPSVSRLKVLCDEYDICIAELMGIGPDEDYDEDMDDHADDDLDGDHELSGTGMAEANEEEIDQPVIRTLNTLDALRESGLADNRRRAMKLAEDATMELRYLEPDELISIADKRGLYRGDCPSPKTIENIFRDDCARGQELCGKIEDRIVDTAMLGVDLHHIDRGRLIDLAEMLADKHEIQMNGSFLMIFDAWGNHEEIVTAIRPVLRKQSLIGQNFDIGNEQKFPIRK